MNNSFRQRSISYWNNTIVPLFHWLSKTHGWCWFLGAGIVVISLYFRLTLYIGADPAFYLITAEKLWHGERYYYDFFESNFPLNFYIFIIPVWLSAVLGVSKIIGLAIFATVLAVVSIIFSSWLLKKTTVYANAALYNLLIISFFWGHFFPLCTFPTNEIGTKTLLFLSFILPYFCGFFCKMEERPLSLPVNILLGVLAGLAVALKPHYAVFLVMMELYYLLKKRNIFLAFRAENYAILATTIIHLLWLVLYVPEYVFKIVPMLTVAYRGIPESFIKNFFLKAIFPQLPIIVIIGLFLKRAKRSYRDELLGLAVAATIIIRGLEGLVSWDQTSIPAFFTGMMLVKILLDIVRRNVSFSFIETAVVSPMVLLVVIIVTLNLFPYQRHLLPLKNMLSLTEELTTSQDAIMVIAIEMYAYPVLMYKDRKYPYKLVSLSFLEGTENSLLRYAKGSPEKFALAEKTKAYFIDTVIDGLKAKPKLLFMNNRGFNLHDRCTISYKEYFMQFPAFRQEFAHYQLYDRYKAISRRNRVKADILVYIRKDTAF